MAHSSDPQRDLAADAPADKLTWAMDSEVVDKNNFVFPDLGEPLDPATYLDAVPSHARAKGMFFSSVLAHAKKGGITLTGFGPYRGFKDYPLREAMELQLAVAQALYPNRSLREGLRELGRLAYPTLAGSMVGKVVFGPFGDDLPALLKLAAKGYALSQNVGRAQVLEVHEDSGVVRLSDMYDFPDCYQVGVFDGVLRHHKHRGDVKIRPVDDRPFTIDLWIRWDVPNPSSAYEY